MLEDMAQVHMTEAEVTSNFAAVLEKLRQGAEIVVERDAQPAERKASFGSNPGRPRSKGVEDSRGVSGNRHYFLPRDRGTLIQRLRCAKRAGVSRINQAYPIHLCLQRPSKDGSIRVCT